jgi:hypothetical protein
MGPRIHPSSIRITNLLKPLPNIKKGQRRSRMHALEDAKALSKAIENNKSRKASQLRAAVNESRAQESLGGKRNRKTAKRRRAKKSCGWFW